MSPRVSTASDQNPVQRWSSALAHPLRARILEYLLSSEPASPSEIALEFQRPLGMVGYHMRCLYQLGLVQLVNRSQVRGAIKHDYGLVDRATTIRALEHAEDLGRLVRASDPSRELNEARRLNRFGQAVRRRREATQTTTAVLAVLAGTTPAYLDRIERGAADPPYTVLVRLANALGFTDPFTEMMEPPAEP